MAGQWCQLPPCPPGGWISALGHAGLGGPDEEPAVHAERRRVAHYISGRAHPCMCSRALHGARALATAGQFGQVDWASASATAASSVTLPGPHDWRPHQLLRPLASALAQLAADRPWVLQEGLCSSVCSAVDHGVLQVRCWAGGHCLIHGQDFPPV